MITSKSLRKGTKSVIIREKKNLVLDKAILPTTMLPRNRPWTNISLKNQINAISNRGIEVKEIVIPRSLGVIISPISYCCISKVDNFLLVFFLSLLWTLMV